MAGMPTYDAYSFVMLLGPARKMMEKKSVNKINDREEGVPTKDVPDVKMF